MRSEPTVVVPDRAPAHLSPLAGQGPLAGQIVALQRAAGNRATGRYLHRKPEIARTLARKKQKPAPRDPSDAVGLLMDDEDWSRAAVALGQLGNDDMRARITAMTTRERQLVVEGARHHEPEAWVAAIVTAMMDIDPRNAIVGSLRWARWKHEWTRAAGWFTGLSVADGRNVAKQLDFKHAQLVQVIGDSDYLKQMFPDPWSFVSRTERMVPVMEMLVAHGYPVAGAAGLVGNMMGESGLIPSRIEGSSEATPMHARDFNGDAQDFTDDQVKDRDFKAKTGPKLPGVGIAQWTSGTRRSGLFANGTAILHDMNAQIEYLVSELASNFKSLDGRLRAADVKVDDAADDVLEHFEAPADPEQSRSARRGFAEQAKNAYDAAHPAATPPATP